jgi:hypothetical protein
MEIINGQEENQEEEGSVGEFEIGPAFSRRAEGSPGKTEGQTEVRPLGS